ncbi:exosome complex subunit Csl4, putative [Talaromyces stipitatus ATCC 10500]|uniref:Exosome complex subunit Csl4, putative n=1 Tax=Talaromyces stipitatus (strain ATCC 10500 / CBS 375.48 / QM 6759 / NRRL 1006) TaxID=441959 RepID=B8LYG7_TALSN|nr:exosome complex subunit Csl4, putative [Talaromyces stipitatus ATCC 10500]EED22896.1 exosome complex subunit Csl4, putative [Talaromyces stipitatus ATCC 10500]
MMIPTIVQDIKYLAILAVPGQQLAMTSTYLPGTGTHVQNGIICASIPGPVFVEQLSQTKSKVTKSILSVLRSGIGNIGPDGTVQKVSAHTTTTTTATGTKRPKYNTLPAVDSIVLARVTRVQKRQVTLSILVVLDDITAATQVSDNDNIAAILTSAANPENQSTSDELRFQALIRKEDVRAVEKDRVVLEEMFRVGDIVRGSVISLGDQSFYYLTTARNDLGVVMARSEAGNMMFPVSWKEMKDPVTGQAESRKVARPF